MAIERIPRLPPKAGQAESIVARNAVPARQVSPGSARSILLTLLGEFVLPKGQPVWTSTLLSVLVGAGIAEKSARQAIARAATAGWIDGDRDGRRVSWTVTPGGRHLIESGSRRVHSMSHDGVAWDGRWLVLMTSLPASHRPLRAKFYRALHWTGFGNPSAGLWVNPHAGRIGEARKLIEDFGLSDLTYAFTGTALDIGVDTSQLVARSWDLQAVSHHYEAVTARFSTLRPRTGDAFLFHQVLLVNERQRLPFIDPGLPAELLPAGWAGRKSAAKLEALRDQWRGAAYARWDELASREPPK
jgi:phenylacetic acid degradation operon negative regulatory protein